jgi:hypothetical protein
MRTFEEVISKGPESSAAATGTDYAQIVGGGLPKRAKAKIVLFPPGVAKSGSSPLFQRKPAMTIRAAMPTA